MVVCLLSLLPGSHPSIDLSHDICSMCDDLFSATRFEQVRLMHGWLLPLLKKWISSYVYEIRSSLDADFPYSRNTNASFDASDPALQVYCVATTLLARCRSYGTMLEVCDTRLFRDISFFHEQLCSLRYSLWNTHLQKSCLKVF